MTAIAHIAPGAVVVSGDRTYCVKRLDSADTLLARDLETGQDRIVSFAEIASSSTSDKDAPRPDLEDLQGEAWERACERFRIIEPLLAAPGNRALVIAAAGEHEVGVATLYRWMRAFRETGLLSSLVRRRRSDAGTMRLDEQTEAIIAQVIRERFLKSQKLKMKRTYKEVERNCRKAGALVPHYNTFVQRVRSVAPEIRVRAREGRNAALKYRSQRGSFPGADHPYAVLQIDHTPVDLILVDEIHRLPVGRPWITVAIDVYSRLVAGWYVSFDPPGTLGTGMCIANAILRKDQCLADLGVEYPWPCQGIAAAIHADNAREFRGDALAMACQEWGIHLKFRKVKRPNYGGHIERLLGTLLSEIHALPGTTFSDPGKRENYDSEGHAVMTLKEFERWFAHLVLGQYHHRVHSSLGVTPLKRYQEGILGSDTQPGIGHLPVVTDAEKLRIDFLPFETRIVRPAGIQIANIFYYADVLQRWVGARQPGKLREKRKFVVRYDPRDISSVLFYDPDLKRHFRTPYRDVRRPAMSLWELRTVQRDLKAKGKTHADEETIFAAFDRMLHIEETAKTTTRKTRLAKERRRHHVEAKRVRLPEEAAAPVKPDIPYDVGQLSAYDEIESL